MDAAQPFRRYLLRRLMLVAGITLSTGCESRVSTNDEDTDRLPSTGSTTWTDTQCFVWPQGSRGGGAPSGGDQGGASQGGASQGGAVGGSGGTAGAQPGGGSAGEPSGFGGAPPMPAPACPTGVDAMPYLNTTCAGFGISAGEYKDGQCCYTVQHDCGGVGRPFVAGGRALRASPLSMDSDWCERLEPMVRGLSPAERCALAEAWLRDALLEHASVASFARFALDLMACGAPAELVRAAHEAALDEVRHARACFGLAAAYAGTPLSPSVFPMDGAVEVSADCADVAARAAVEGCVGETLAAVLAAEQLAVATDPAVRAVLGVIAAEEARHAELAWRTVAWAIERGGERVRTAVRASMAAAIEEASAMCEGEAPEGLAAHGRLDGATLALVRARALDEIVRPCAARLLDEARRFPVDQLTA